MLVGGCACVGVCMGVYVDVMRVSGLVYVLAVAVYLHFAVADDQHYVYFTPHIVWI